MVASDCTTSSSRKLILFLKRSEKLVVWKRNTEPKMSNAALELADLDYAATTPRRKYGERELLTQHDLSLTMERYLHSDTTSSCGTLAEF